MKCVKIFVVRMFCLQIKKYNLFCANKCVKCIKCINKIERADSQRKTHQEKQNKLKIM